MTLQKIIVKSVNDIAAQLFADPSDHEEIKRLLERHREVKGLKVMDHFRRFFSKKFGKDIKGFSTATVRALVNYSWPGNVSELEHLIERASLVSPSEIIEPEHFGMEDTAEEQQTSLANKSGKVDREDLVRALEAAEGKKTNAARMLGISRRTLYRKLHEHGLIKSAEQAV